MSKARFFTYRNLNAGDWFSVKQRGKVIGYVNCAKVTDGTFHVLESGRQRCIKKKQRNVHAYVISQKQPQDIKHYPRDSELVEVKYNPFQMGNFFRKDNGQPVLTAEVCYLIHGRAYIPK
jgi:hypothetical protein